MNVLVYILANIAALCTGAIVSSKFKVKYYSDNIAHRSYLYDEEK